MPKTDRYVVYNIESKLYYDVGRGGDCTVSINNATFFNDDEYKFRVSRGDYLRRCERFIKICKDGSKKILE